MAGPLAGLRERAEYAGALVALGALGLLPPATLGRISDRLGRWLVAGLPMMRRRIERNLTRIHPQMDAAGRAALARDIGGHFGRVIGEYAILPRLVRDPALTALSGPGLEALQKARAEGRGAVLVSAHFGNWEMIRAALGHAGIPCGMIYRAFNNRLFDARCREVMRSAGEPVLAKGHRGTRALVTHIARGGVALILVDQKQTGAPRLPFMGHPAETALAAAELASRYRVPLIPAFATRQPDGRRFAVDLEEPVPEAPAAIRMTEVNARIASRIAAHPEQWFWLHNRWR
jgi:Kdo2-lipid IVA lauroyltransferase/acyltransferase